MGPIKKCTGVFAPTPHRWEHCGVINTTFYTSLCDLHFSHFTHISNLVSNTKIYQHLHLLGNALHTVLKIFEKFGTIDDSDAKLF